MLLLRCKVTTFFSSAQEISSENDAFLLNLAYCFGFALTLSTSYLTLFERLFLCAFGDGVADFAFEALFGHGYACRASVAAHECFYGEDYRFKKFFREIVDIFKILDFNCNPLSEVNIIGFSSLYFNASNV